MRTINTVLGEISVTELGQTLSHEHILMVNNDMRYNFPDWIDINAIEQQAVKSLRKAKALGVSTIIDATPINLGRDIDLLRRVSQRSEVNIIASTGFYFHESPWFDHTNYCIDRAVDILEKECIDGINGTDIKPGIIKCATEAPELSPMNEAFLRTAARLHTRTGLPIMTHANAFHRNGLKQLEIFKEEKIDLSNVIIGHCDDANDIDYVLTLLNYGCYIGMDRLGAEHINSLHNRISMIETLVNLGFSNKLMLSHDCDIFSDCGNVCGNRRIKQDEQNWNFFLTSEVVLPELTGKGISEVDIENLKYNNIQRFFENAGANLNL